MSFACTLLSRSSYHCHNGVQVFICGRLLSDFSPIVYMTVAIRNKCHIAREVFNTAEVKYRFSSPFTEFQCLL